MKELFNFRSGALLGLLATLGAWPVALPATESVTDAIAVVRSLYATEREALMAENMQFSDAEGEAFWPIYQKHREAKEALGDELVKVVLEYADLYPNLPEDRARDLLKRYTKLEKQLASQRDSYLKKVGKVLPAAKTLRVAQLENRMDLAMRLQLAEGVPLAPIEGRLTAVSAGAAARVSGGPGGAIVQTHQLVATVIAINKARRELTLLSQDSIKETVQVGPEAVNFDQISVGDRLQIEVTEELIVYMAGAGEATGDAAEAVVALAPQGASPAGVMAETVQLTATVTGIDQQKRMATLRFEDGTTKTLPVRRDVDLNKYKAGDKLVVSAAQKVAVAVTKP